MGMSHETTLLAFVTDGDNLAVLEKIPFQDLGVTAKIMRGDSKAAYQYLKLNKSPSILVLDLSGVALPLSEVERISEVCEPTVEVITLGEKNDVSVFRQLISLGVRDYLVKPILPNLIVKSINDILQNSTTETDATGFSHNAHIVAFIGVSGGVGTSTFALNCAISMADDHNKHVSLVDFDMVAAPLAHMIDSPATSGLIKLLGEKTQVDQTVLDRILTPYGKRLSVLSADDDTLTSYHHCAPAMKQLLSLMTQNYNYTVVDCGAGTPSTLKELALTFADTVVLVCETTFASVWSTARLIRYFKDHAAIEQKLIVVANKAENYKSGEIPQADFEAAIDHPVAYVAHFDAHAPLLCLNVAKPLVQEESQLGSELKTFAAFLVGKPLPRVEKSFLSTILKGKFGL